MIFLASFCNFYFIVAVGWGEAIGAAMSANTNVPPSEIDIFHVLYEIDAYSCLASIVASAIFLVLFKWYHKQLYYPTRLLILLTAIQIVASTVIALHQI